MNIDPKRLSDIAHCVLRCEDIIDNEWELLVVVYEVGDGHIANSGFLYNGEDVLPIITEIEELPLLLDDKIVELREAIYRDCGHQFNQMLFQMESATNRFNIEFDFDHKNPWKISPANFIKMRSLLKPNFSGD